MRNVERRLERLERLPQMQTPPTPLEQIRAQALRRLSDGDLALMRILAIDRNAQVDRKFSDGELEMWQTYQAALETEAQRMGFNSYAQAERHGERK